MAARKIRSFEEGLAQLEALVEKMENGDLPLDQAFAAHEKGVILLRDLTAMLDAGEKRLAELTEAGEKALTIDMEENNANAE